MISAKAEGMNFNNIYKQNLKKCCINHSNIKIFTGFNGLIKRSKVTVIKQKVNNIELQKQNYFYPTLKRLLSIKIEILIIKYIKA